jgi:hypothetical protein
MAALRPGGHVDSFRCVVIRVWLHAPGRALRSRPSATPILASRVPPCKLGVARRPDQDTTTAVPLADTMSMLLPVPSTS